MILILALLFVVVVVQFGIIRGFLRSEKSKGIHKCLTGREVEQVRRKLSVVGFNAVTPDDVYGLIKTIRDTHLGTYVDDDPYVPDDPYDDIGR
jgi:hypothetical protein